MDLSISNFTDALKKYVVMPRGEYGVDGFIFDIYGDETVNLTAEITDHTIEDNSQIQDHITLKPKKIRLIFIFFILSQSRSKQSFSNICIIYWNDCINKIIFI